MILIIETLKNGEENFLRTINDKFFNSDELFFFSKLDVSKKMWHTKPRIYTLAYTYARGVKTRRREEDPRRIAVGARGKKSGCQGSVIQNFRCTLGLSSPLAASHFQLTWKERVCPSSWAAYTRPRQCKDVLLRLAGSFFLAETSTTALSKAVEEEAAFIRGQGCISFCQCSLSLLREPGYNGDGNNFLPLLLSSVRAGFWARGSTKFSA